MARPLRRALIGLSIRIGVSITEIELLPIPVVREYLAMLHDMNKPREPEPPRPQSPEEIRASFSALLSKPQE